MTYIEILEETYQRVVNKKAAGASGIYLCNEFAHACGVIHRRDDFITTHFPQFRKWIVRMGLGYNPEYEWSDSWVDIDCDPIEVDDKLNKLGEYIKGLKE